MKLIVSVLTVACLGLIASDATAGCYLFQRLRDRRAERRQGPQQCQPQTAQTAPMAPLTYVPGEPMPEPAAFGISLPPQSSCANGQCSPARGLRR